ncbi:MAG: HAD family hydrolase [Terracidiphilus sp.]
MQPIIQQNRPPRLHIEPGFAWDGQDAYLFDIDGTLLRCNFPIHMGSILSSVFQATGYEVSLSGVPIDGNTDTGILREACRQAEIPAEILEPRFEAILESMRRAVASERHRMAPVRMPGVEETLIHLTQKGALLGLATGNLEEIGWIKVEEAGLRNWFRFGGFSDKFPLRTELIGQAARKAREMAGAAARVCVVGDTPRDIAAARANSLPVIAVASGGYSFDALLEHQPEVCASSLADLLAQSQVAP